MQKYILIFSLGIIFLTSCSKEDTKIVVPPIQEPPSSVTTSPYIVPSSLSEMSGPIEKNGCITELIESDIRGTSMLPLYQEGDTIEYASGYYLCHDVKRDDIVIFNHGNDQLIIKRVVGVPGDEWKYQSGRIILNNNPLKNSEGDTYQIQSKMLTIYAESYPTIPRDTYMILGNQIDGTLDSSKFGLIAKQDIVGKVDTTKKKR